MFSFARCVGVGMLIFELILGYVRSDKRMGIYVGVYRIHFEQEE